LCSAWGKAVSRQHALLGWCMRTLEDANVLPASVLNNPGPFDDTFRPNEGVELVCEPLSLADLNNLWEVLRPDIPVSVGYVVRAVPLESTLPLAEYDPVQTRELRFEQ
jgi:uncharacterized protein DUF4255